MNMLKKKLIKIQFVNAKTQFENAKTQKTAQVVAWTCLDRRSKKSPAFITFFVENVFAIEIGRRF